MISLNSDQCFMPERGRGQHESRVRWYERVASSPAAEIAEVR